MALLIFPLTFTINPLVALLLVVLAVVWFLKVRDDYKLFEKLKIPGPKPMMVFGSIGEFKDKNPLDVFKEWRKLYGDIFGFFEGFTPSLVVNCPEMAKQILVKHFDKFHVRPLCNPFVYSPDESSLLNTYGNEWKRQRSIVAAAFNSVSMKHMSNRVNATGDKFCRKVTEQNKRNPDGFDVTDLIDRYTLDAFADSGFDFEANSLDNEDALLYRFMKEFNHSAAADNPIAGLARVYPGLTPFLQLFDGKHKQVHEENMKQIREHVVRKRQEYSQSSSDEQKNFLGQMINCSFFDRDEYGIYRRRQLKDQEIVGHINSLIGGGIGTLNACLSFVIHMLAMNPTAQQKAFQEVIKICGYEKSPTFDDIQKMEYLQMILHETLRLLPCAPGVTRRVTEDCNINGVEFKKDVVVRVMTCTLYSDEKIYPQPEKFIPERFSPEEIQKRHAFSYLPYGQGPRMCPGLKFADLQVKVAMVKLLQRFVIKPCSQTIDPLPTALRPMLCPKDGVFVHLEDRVRPNMRSNTCSA
ncbi:cytochrome P450 3A4-like [Mytilus trossulus]|uniref:cytochrome P450 3A4-like n=1 Tax=Mytilus trossulus TaxID=6551 RepID=UPI003004D223